MPRRGHTALHYAARAGQEDIVRALLRAGADFDAKSFFTGSTPRELHQSVPVSNCGSSHVVITHCTMHGVDAVSEAATHGHAHITRVLLDFGADPGATANYGSCSVVSLSRTRLVVASQLQFARHTYMYAAGE